MVVEAQILPWIEPLLRIDGLLERASGRAELLLFPRRWRLLEVVVRVVDAAEVLRGVDRHELLDTRRRQPRLQPVRCPALARLLRAQEACLFESRLEVAAVLVCSATVWLRALSSLGELELLEGNLRRKE